MVGLGSWFTPLFELCVDKIFFRMPEFCSYLRKICLVSMKMKLACCLLFLLHKDTVDFKLVPPVSYVFDF